MKRQTKTWAIKRSLCSPRKPALTHSSLAVPTRASNNRASVPPPLAFCSSFHIACRHMVAEYISSLSSSRCPFLPRFRLASDTSTWWGIKGLSLQTVRRAVFDSFDVAHSLDMLHRKTYHVKVWSSLSASRLLRDFGFVWLASWLWMKLVYQTMGTST